MHRCKEVLMAVFGRMLIAGLLVALPLCAGWGQSEDADPPLLTMLAYVPQEAAMTPSGWATVRFADYEALYVIEGITLLRELGDAELLLKSVPLAGMLGRLTAGPEALNYIFPSAGGMVDAVGFEWLLDVDRSLEFGDPPDLGLLLGGSFDPAAIGTALQSRGFTLRELHGVPVWHRLDDREISLAERNVADPFGGHLGAAARIAVFPDLLANARSWPLIDAVVSAAQGGGPSLADDAGYRALTEAVSRPGGVLLQALFFPGAALRYPGAAPPGEPEPTDLPGPLPAFSLAVLADRQEVGDQVHLIALVCRDEPTAQTAADALTMRLTAFHLPDHPNDPLVDRFGASLNASVVARPEDGVALAIVEARYPMPSERIDPVTGLFNTRGLLFRHWIIAILRRAFTPLW
jgi:hypothetical protein